MTREILERANELSQWICGATEKLSDVSEYVRLLTEKKDDGSQRAASLTCAELDFRMKLNFDYGATESHCRIQLEKYIVIKALKEEEEYLKKWIKKAQDELDSL